MEGIQLAEEKHYSRINNIQIEIKSLTSVQHVFVYEVVLFITFQPSDRPAASRDKTVSSLLNSRLSLGPNLLKKNFKEEYRVLLLSDFSRNFRHIGIYKVGVRTFGSAATLEG